MHDKDSTCKYEHALILFHLCANLGYMLRIYIHIYMHSVYTTHSIYFVSGMSLTAALHLYIVHIWCCGIAPSLSPFGLLAFPLPNPYSYVPELLPPSSLTLLPLVGVSLCVHACLELMRLAKPSLLCILIDMPSHLLTSRCDCQQHWLLQPDSTAYGSWAGHRGQHHHSEPRQKQERCRAWSSKARQ